MSALRRRRTLAGTLQAAIAHFTKVARRYHPGLFHCYAVLNLPRTENHLEHAFGPPIYHERCATGRKGIFSAAMLRGEVPLIAATATRLHDQSAADLARTEWTAWRSLRAGLDQRRQAGILRTRFSRDPQTYLQDLEQKAPQLTLLCQRESKKSASPHPNQRRLSSLG